MEKILREPRHFQYIDALRGLAFLSVLASHTIPPIGPFFLHGLLMEGANGVQLFFIASAITLCHSMASRQKDEDRPILYFYLRRFFRIAPLFWLAMLFYWAFPAALPMTFPFQIHASYYALTAVFLHGWNPYAFNCAVPGGWSIAVEMTFYLIFPILFFYINNTRKAAVAVLIGFIFTDLVHSIMYHGHGILFPSVPDDTYYFFANLWFPAQVGVFLIGIFTYYLLKEHSVNLLAQSRFWAGCIFLFALWLIVRGLLTTQLMLVLAFAVIAIALSQGRVPFVVNPVVCYIGKLSYSCYLVHFACISLARHLLGLSLRPTYLEYDTGRPLMNFIFFLVCFFLTLLLTIPAAFVTFHLVESPGIAAGRRIIRRMAAACVRPDADKIKG